MALKTVLHAGKLPRGPCAVQAPLPAQRQTTRQMTAIPTAALRLWGSLC